MKNYKVIMGMLALALVFGLAGCQNPATSNWYDGQYANVGKNVLAAQEYVYSGATGTVDNRSQRYHFKTDGTYTIEQRLINIGTLTESQSGTGNWTVMSSGNYTYNTVQQFAILHQIRVRPPNAAQYTYQETLNAPYFATAGITDEGLLTASRAANTAQDDGLVDSYGQYAPLINYLRANEGKYKLLYNAGYNPLYFRGNGTYIAANSLSEVEILDGTGYSTIREYLDDYVAVTLRSNQFSFSFDGASRTKVYY
ncbi:hypothetical protein AGMMS49546_01150 [Spirochaetia bacterium]|nr:hypothetical protein AGMMS49546_01150 [Spirochaetia bacterium]